MLENIKLLSNSFSIILRASCYEVLLIVFFSLLSKLSSVLALFLPIKIILLVGHDKTPKYLPDSMAAIDKDTLVITLSVLAILFYVVHIIAERVIEKFEMKGTKNIFVKPRGGATGKDKQFKSSAVQKIFRRTSKSLTEIVFTLTVATFLGVVYPSLLALMIVYSAIVIACYEFFVKRVSSDDVVSDDDPDSEDSNIKVWFDIGFLLAFVFIVWNLMTNEALNIITAFIGFLLLRQSSAGLKRMTKDIIYLTKQKTTIQHLHSKN